MLASYLSSARQIGVLTSFREEVYPIVFSIWEHGGTYIPVNPTYPVARLQSILQQVQLDVLIVTQKQFNDLSKLVLEVFEQHTKIFVVEKNLIASECKVSRVFTNTQSYLHDRIAYILFTSGSTGQPKGVPITYGNLAAFVEVMQNNYHIHAEDRIAQFANLTFDMSIFDLALAFASGAKLYRVPENELLMPIDFIRRHAITIWFSVPSVIQNLVKLNALSPNCFPSLRLSLFSGETLSAQAAKAWQLAAPNSRVENFYGPTEATVSCSKYTYSENIAELNVPIGQIFPGTLAAVINESFDFLSNYQQGELLLAGKQLTPGYWMKPELTAEKFIELTHPVYGLQRWYRTGDLVFQDEKQQYHYKGRIDHQVKINGFRVELEEVETHLRVLMQSDDVAVAAVEVFDAMQLVVVYCESDFISEHDKGVLSCPESREKSISHIKAALKQRLPEYMIPRFWQLIPQLPYNMNGKLDRKILQTWLQKQFSVRA